MKDRIVNASHGTLTPIRDSSAEKAFANHLRKTLTTQEINYCLLDTVRV